LNWFFITKLQGGLDSRFAMMPRKYSGADPFFVLVWTLRFIGSAETREDMSRMFGDNLSKYDLAGEEPLPNGPFDQNRSAMLYSSAVT
jgi:hypothetical protein